MYIFEQVLILALQKSGNTVPASARGLYINLNMTFFYNSNSKMPTSALGTDLKKYEVC